MLRAAEVFAAQRGEILARSAAAVEHDLQHAAAGLRAPLPGGVL